MPRQEEGEGASDRLLLSGVWPGGAAALPAGAMLPISWMPVQPGYLPRPHPEPPGPPVQPGRQWLTLRSSLPGLFSKLGNTASVHVTGMWTSIGCSSQQEESCCCFLPVH